MSSILHISDTHFGTEVVAVRQGVLALHRELRPDLVVLSGDVTQRARRGQFARARTFLDALAPRALLVLPGNHDVPLYHLPLRLLDPYGPYRKAFGGDLEPSFESHDLLVVGVNTTRARRLKDGEISSSQIDAVARRLVAARVGQLRVVVTHQPLHVVTAHDETNLTHNSEAAVRAWCDAGADLLLGGHIHLPYVRPVTDRYPDLSRRAWVVQAGTALSSRVRGRVPNSVNVLRYDERAAPAESASAAGAAAHCVVERWDFDERGAAFGCVSRDVLPLDRDVAPPGDREGAPAPR